MRRMFVILLLSLFVLSCSSKTDKTNSIPKGMQDGKITIFMQGDKGTNYSGHIQVISADGSSAGQTVEGSVPEVYEFKGVIVSASFQKKGDNSRNLLVLITDEKHFPDPVKTASTTAPFGVVTVSLSLSSTR